MLWDYYQVPKERLCFWADIIPTEANPHIHESPPHKTRTDAIFSSGADEGSRGELKQGAEQTVKQPCVASHHQPEKAFLLLSISTSSPYSSMNSYSSFLGCSKVL